MARQQPNQGHLTSAAALGSQGQGTGSQAVAAKAEPDGAPKACVTAAAIGELKHTGPVFPFKGGGQCPSIVSEGGRFGVHGHRHAEVLVVDTFHTCLKGAKQGC